MRPQKGWILGKGSRLRKRKMIFGMWNIQGFPTKVNEVISEMKKLNVLEYTKRTSNIL